ncbi:alpha/beta fold hydrolase [Mesorhizobium sp. DCY119]|uniref:alpha/beta fold hydrolase n=1 Tax=Mesorhizobium sp. DCY119 TaxID=2108445 RepID=UPI001403B1CF|nr:alpha/beta fold hydrolase [Mesorhizobium sp. DCY119]
MKTYLLIHGAWHNSHHWHDVALALGEAGHRVVLLDLPGHGVNATLPQSYLFGPAEALATEVSPVAGVTLAQAAEAVADAIRALNDSKLIVVAHSLGGTILTQAAEAVPELIGHLVYLTAYAPVKLGTSGAYGALPENQTGYGTTLFVADPAKVGAVRLNPRGDEAYLRQLWEAYYNDLAFENFLIHANALTPDLPVDFWIGNVSVTAGKWGSIPRTYIRALQDRALAPALQDVMIAHADELTPHNRFEVIELDSSHSPFASQPTALVAMLAKIG